MPHTLEANETGSIHRVAAGRINLAHERPFRLGPLSVDPGKRHIGHDDGREEILEPRVMQVLVALVRADGDILSRDDMIQCCWDGRIVGEDAIVRVISRLRRTAESLGENVFRIETITKVGYRLVREEGIAVPAWPGRPHRARVSRRAAIAGGIGIGAIAAAGAGSWLLFKPAEAKARRIAVLPFANLSGAEEHSYFAEGIAEELRSALARLGMEVIGRASSRAVKDLDSRTAAERLGVANILTGSVRRSPEVVRVSAQLVSGKDGVQRWAQSYDRLPGEEIKIQADIAASVAEALDIILDQGELAALNLGGTSDSVAQDLVLQARQLRRSPRWKDNLHRSLGFVEAAIARDPNYALAYFEKATLLVALAMLAENAEQMVDRIEHADLAATRALAIAPAMGLSHLAKFSVEQARLNFAAALNHLRRALALTPDDPDILEFSPGVLAPLGQGTEAMRLADRFIAIDPLNATGHVVKGVVLYWLRQYPQTIQALRKALEMQPENSGPNAGIGVSMLLMDQPEQALAAFRRLAADDPWRLFGEAMVAIRTGDAAAAGRRASELRKRFYVVQEAVIYAQLGQKERAFAALNDALVSRDPSLIGLKRDPFVDPLRDDPRFTELVGKLNFPN